MEYTLAYRIVRPDGSVREILSRGRPLADPAGSVVRLTGTLQDVTEENRAARELARVNTELVQLNELNADVIGMLGHDVRGPLAVVLGYLEELDEEWEATTESMRKRHVATARAAATRLRTLVDDILALAAVESGKIAPEASDHDLAVLVAEALSRCPATPGSTSTVTVTSGSGATPSTCDRSWRTLPVTRSGTAPRRW